MKKLFPVLLLILFSCNPEPPDSDKDGIIDLNNGFTFKK